MTCLHEVRNEVKITLRRTATRLAVERALVCETKQQQLDVV